MVLMLGDALGVVAAMLWRIDESGDVGFDEVF